VTRIRFEGWHVAQMDLEPLFSSWGVSDHVLLYRTPTTWTLLTVAVHERFDEHGTPVDGRGTASTQTLSTEELADVVRDRYGESGWRELLDAAHDRDPDLYRAWVPTRLERDFDRASLHCKDLALYTGLLGGRPVPAPARELPDWQADAVARMAEHLPSLGFEVDNATVTVAVDDDGDPANPTLGALSVRRYGFEAIGIVRVDDVGEVYIRLADADEVGGPPLRALTEIAEPDLAPEPPSLDW